MRKTFLFSLVLAGAGLCFEAAIPAYAQQGGVGPGATGAGQTSGTGPGAAGSPGVAAPLPEQTANDSSMPQSSPKMDDKKFVKEAAIGGLAEVELGKLATQKASSDAVKQFGQRMVDDHSKANDELKQVATKEGFEVPSALDKKHQASLDKLSKLSGADFDKAYVKNMTKDHEKDVKDFQSESQNGTNANVKSFATKTLPVLQEHLTAIKTLKDTKSASAMDHSKMDHSKMDASKM